MPRASAYEIIDEPAPSTLTRFAVSPMFPLLAFMLGGAWLGWAWIAFNGYAFGSATRRRELGVALAAPLLTFTLCLALALLYEQQLVSRPGLQYILLSVGSSAI